MAETCTPPAAGERKDVRVGVAALATAILGTSLSSLLYKLSYTTGLHPMWVNVIRFALTVLIMAPMTLLNTKNRRNLHHISKGNFWLSALSGTLLAFHFTTWAMALQKTDVVAATAIIGTNLLITALFSSLVLKEKTSRGALVGMLIATAGVALCNLGGSTGTLIGNLYALIAAILIALYMLCGRKVLATVDVNTYTSIVYTFAFVWMLIQVWVSGVPATGFAPQNLLWGLGLAVFATLLGHTMQSVALRYFKAPTVSAVMLANMAMGPLIVLIVLGDKPTRNTLTGSLVIFIGVALYLYMEHKDAKKVQADTDAT